MTVQEQDIENNQRVDEYIYLNKISTLSKLNNKLRSLGVIVGRIEFMISDQRLTNLLIERHQQYLELYRQVHPDLTEEFLYRQTYQE